MIKNKKGSVISLAGGGSVGPRENFSAYSSSKTALVRFSENLSKEYIKYNINFNCISPGVMKSKLTNEILNSNIKILSSSELIKMKVSNKEHLFTLNKVSDMIFFLISKKGKKITGKILSSKWDDIEYISTNIKKINSSDIFTLRRILKLD